MAYEIELAASFERDYGSTIEYLVGTLKSPQAARGLMEEVSSAQLLLSQLPFIHAVSQRRNLRERGVRVHALKSYAVLYVVNGGRVFFLRLVHKSQCFDSDRYWRGADSDIG